MTTSTSAGRHQVRHDTAAHDGAARARGREDHNHEPDFGEQEASVRGVDERLQAFGLAQRLHDPRNNDDDDRSRRDLREVVDGFE
ncbi:MAG: hypothetical protein SGJ13_17180 [Actinomycetota bacterium]|nr:hypothetical protein [Actinomycetota bacterium]